MMSGPGRRRSPAALLRVLAELGLVSLDRDRRSIRVPAAERTALERSAAFRAYAARLEDGQRYLSEEQPQGSVSTKRPRPAGGRRAKAPPAGHRGGPAATAPPSDGAPRRRPRPRASARAVQAPRTPKGGGAARPREPVDVDRGHPGAQVAGRDRPHRSRAPPARRPLRDRRGARRRRGVEIDRDEVERAFVFACEHHADQRRKSGEDFITHPVGVAKICAGMRLDTETLCAALLHDTVEDTSASLDEVREASARRSRASSTA